MCSCIPSGLAYTPKLKDPSESQGAIATIILQKDCLGLQYCDRSSYQIKPLRGYRIPPTFIRRYKNLH
ncbi:MAG: hypothetical protein HC773_30305 [Scytonema sp. CRU_2_7]|nr:hypothetical protein [Scytonema sp. CRU_2_7]